MGEQEDRRTAIRSLLTGVAADLRAWAEWAADTGADELPFDDSPPVRPLSARLAVAAPAAPRDAVPPAAARPRPAADRPRTSPGIAAAPPPSARPGASSPELLAVRQDLGECTRCRLHAGRHNIVFGVGNPAADLVVVGEGPGYYEDQTGEPFVGRAGQLLTRMLAAIGVARADAYICNVVKCRPPDNRDPLPDEVAACAPFLERQLEALRPKVIVPVGRFAAQVICGTDESLTRLRGSVRAWRSIPVVPTYHPAYLLRRPEHKRETWSDLLRARALLREAKPD
ncbi:MAG: uracil-DNA glycosylase [Deltaproteobacteria bacterium]|nr:uracil-DNA glycosylase [Deltaproteobacteria bacterium]